MNRIHLLFRARGQPARASPPQIILVRRISRKRSEYMNAQIIAVANQKGGVGKTTTRANLEQYPKIMRKVQRSGNRMTALHP